MNIDKYIARFKFFLSLSFDPEDVSDIASEYRTYLEEEVKNGNDEKEIIQRYGNPSALANKLRKDNELSIIKFGLVVRFTIFLIYCAFSFAIWEHLVNSILFFSSYFIVSLTILWFGVTKSGYSHEKDTSDIRFKKGAVISLICHSLGGIFSLLFLFNQYRNIDHISVPYNLLLQSLVLYLLGILFAVIFHLIRVKKSILQKNAGDVS